VSPFPKPLLLKKLKGRTFELVAPFEYNGHGIHVELPAGATTDFASIPRVLWWVLDPIGPWAEIAVVHDFIYRSKCYSREVADAIFLQGLRECGCAKWQMWSLYVAVRAFGWFAYKGDNLNG
jgi:hypothetical protein